MGRRPLIDSTRADGLLVAPFGLKILSKAAYRPIRWPGTRAMPVVEKFRQRLRRELVVGDSAAGLRRRFRSGRRPATYALKQVLK